MSYFGYNSSFFFLSMYTSESDGRGLMVLDVLKEISLPNLESLSIRNGKFDRGAVSVFETMPKLRKLSCANPFRSPVVVIYYKLLY